MTHFTEAQRDEIARMIDAAFLRRDLDSALSYLTRACHKLGSIAAELPHANKYRLRTLITSGDIDARYAGEAVERAEALLTLLREKGDPVPRPPVLDDALQAIASYRETPREAAENQPPVARSSTPAPQAHPPAPSSRRPTPSASPDSADVSVADAASRGEEDAQ